MSKERKKILVTGGAGFIGSHLCERLLILGHAVVCLDNFCTGSKKNIEPLLPNDHFKLMEHDVRIPIPRMEIDAIFHLASPASPDHYQRDPIQTIKTIVLGTINMLELAWQETSQIIHASTSEIYGDPQVHPQAENDWGHVNPIGPRACYDEGKRCAETLCMDYHRRFGVDVRIARIFNTYGPRMAVSDGRVVSNFIVQALREEPLTLYGDGSQTRSFQYVDDLINGLIALFEIKNFTGPVNLGNPEEYKIREIAERVIAEVHSKSIIEYKPLPVDDPRRRQPDIRLAREKLNWSPQISFEEGLRKTIDYFRTQV